MYFDMEMLYDDPVDDIPAFKKRIVEIFEAWKELEESYDKDTMICRFMVILSDIRFGMDIEDLDDEIEMIENEYKYVCMKYSIDDTEDVMDTDYEDLNRTF